MTNVTFYGPTQSVSDLLDLILGNVGANDAGTHACTICASKKQAGWMDAAIVSALTAAETPNAPTGCFGVYREATARAWLVNTKSPYESKIPGFSIRICDSHIGISYDWLADVAAPAGTPSCRLPVRGRM